MTNGALVAALALLFPMCAAAQSIIAPASATPGSLIAVTVTGGPGNPLDWVGLYATVATPQGNYLQWKFLNGTQTIPVAGLTGATLTFIAPATLGTYDLRWFANGGYTRITVSAAIAVGGATAPPALGKVVFNGDSNTAPYYESGPTNWTQLAAAGLGFPTSVNLAVEGKYAAGVLAEVGTMAGLNADLCLVMIGTNDMANAVEHGVPDAAARVRYLDTMRAIIAGLKPGCRKLAILSPIFVMKPREVARYDGWVDGLRSLCAEFDVPFLDVYGHMKALSGFQTSAQFDALFLVPGVDFYHLSTAGHTMLANFVARSGKLTP